MITPRTTRLVRVLDLQGFQRAIVDCVPTDPFEARGCAIVVPSESAAEELRRSIENARVIRRPAANVPAALVLPDIVTRGSLYARLHERCVGAPRLLSPFDREVLLRRAAHEVRKSGLEPPFNIRPGLVAELLGLYDELRRHDKTVDDFERLLVGALEPGAEIDRGTARLLQQTEFLVAAFRSFEDAVAATDGMDEHRLRDALLAGTDSTYRHVIVTVGDQAGDPRGLWTADFNLLARLPGLARLDVIATEARLESGFHERLHDLLPGIAEERLDAAAPPPTLLVPAVQATDERAYAFVARDREEELAEFARYVKGAHAVRPGPGVDGIELRSESLGQAAFDFDRAEPDAGRLSAAASEARGTPHLETALDRCAIVFQRPLPYLYLARQVFSDAALPWQALDALPLAAEPFAALVDVVFAVLSANFTRAALLELLRSPHLVFDAGGRPLSLRDTNALDRWLVEKKYLGGVDRLEALAESGNAAVTVAAAAARELETVVRAESAPAQIDAVLSFLTRHERTIDADAAWASRHARARAAVVAALQMLRDAHARHDPQVLTIGELAGAVRRWIEGQTFAPRLGSSGVILLDARAAAYAELDDVRLVGLTEGDWPERTPRNIFYPQSLLSPLGWPSDEHRLRESRAAFQDLLRVARRRVSLSTFTLEDDAIVAPTPLLEDVGALGLPVERDSATDAGCVVRVFAHEAISIDPVVATAVDEGAAAWLTVRLARPVDAALYQGTAGARAPAVYAISRVEKFLDCPFRYFAGHVLRLPEERDEEAWMSPQERGAFVHDVFCEFFTAWQQAGRGVITPVNAADAMAMFRDVAEAHLAELPETDRALERTLLLGSAAAAGLAERAFAVEIEDGFDVQERLLEFPLEGAFHFSGGAPDAAPRTVEIRAKADRIDLLANGTLRVIDYKLGRAPDRKRALQVPIYGVCAEQALDGRHGRSWRVARAGYVAFKEKVTFADIGKDVASALQEGQVRFLEAVDGIERGAFPPQPAEPYLCNWCPYPSVCRKDYVGDE